MTPRLALLLATPGIFAGANWFELPTSLRPRWRYSHAAAALGPHFYVSLGYNLRAPDGSSTPDWRSDTWRLSDGTWTELQTVQEARPVARYGHSLLALSGGLVLFGGDDGGRSDGGAYTRGSYRNDLWELGNGDVWLPAAVVSDSPPPRSMHACVSVLLPSSDGSFVEDAALCHGGIIRATSAAAPEPSLGGWSMGPPVENAAGGDVWVLRRAAAEGANATYSWTLWSPAPGEAVPVPRHGHSVAYVSRLVIESPASPTMRVEHSVFLFGGTALNCSMDPAWLHANSISPSETRAYKRGAGSYACELGDTWRLVWTSDPLPTLPPRGGRGPSTLPAPANPPLPVGAHWERVEFGDPTVPVPGTVTLLPRQPEVSSAQAWQGEWLVARGGGGLRSPPPRTMAAAAAMRAGVVLSGGAICAPGCQVFSDTFRLLVAPVAVSEVEEGSLGAPLRLGHVSAKAIGAAWSTVSVAPDRGDRAAVASLPSWLRGASAAVAPPPPRHRHSLTAIRDNLVYYDEMLSILHDLIPLSPDTGSWVQALRDIFPVAAMPLLCNDTAGAAPPRLRAESPARVISQTKASPTLLVMFGGENYAPGGSTYRDDTWVWVDPTEEALLSAPARARLFKLSGDSSPRCTGSGSGASNYSVWLFWGASGLSWSKAAAASALFATAAVLLRAMFTRRRRPKQV